MRIHTLGLWSLVVVAGCGGPNANSGTDGGVVAAPLAVCSPMLPTSAMPSTTVEPLAGESRPDPTASVFQNSGVCTEISTALTRAQAADLTLPDGYTKLGAALAFAGSSGPFPHGVDFVVPCDLTLGPPNAPNNRIEVVELRANGQTVIVPASNITYEPAYKRLHFHAPELGTYQCAIPSTAGATVTRHYTWRGIGGVSMGGFGSTVNFWTHPDRYDVLGVMGADPGADFTYTLGLVGDWFMGGFCDAASGKLGQLCTPTRLPLTDQWEEFMDFEHLNYQAGEGVGLTLRRTTFMRAYRDLSRALGNAAYLTNTMNSSGVGLTYLPPGVDPGVQALNPSQFCDPGRTTAASLKNFYDWRYNPDGKLPVITFCDGGDGTAKGYAVFDGSLPQTDPMPILLAVDVNGNGVRDSGEPVIVQATEHFQDCGVDGKCDKDEAGYDPVTNPDPAHDDYQYYFNPGGTENNWRYDEGEPYDDYGVDGVMGTCQLGATPPNGVGGCYDYGEGNGKFDVSPNAHNWYSHDVHSILSGYLDVPKISDDDLARVDIYYDAGIRDFFNAEVATNSIVGALDQRGQQTRIWDGFPLLAGLAPSQENNFRIEDVDVPTLGRHLYVRYGDPDATEEAVEQTGDGRHVGTVIQAIHRGQMLFYFYSRAWPDGDVSTDVGPGKSENLMFTTSSGRVTPYSVVTPPGYFDAANAGKGYPTVYLMHGYGMQPSDLAQVAVIANNAMIDDSVPAERRMQKMIIVLVDAVCRPGGDLGDPNQAVPLTADLCEEGTFYTDHAEGDYQGEEMLIELQTLIEKNYRTKAPADLQVSQ